MKGENHSLLEFSLKLAKARIFCNFLSKFHKWSLYTSRVINSNHSCKKMSPTTKVKTTVKRSTRTAIDRVTRSQSSRTTPSIAMINNVIAAASTSSGEAPTRRVAPSRYSH